MSQDRETNLALFIDFDNVALGARDARQRFDIKPLLNRILEKGKIIVKKAYADWHYYKEHMMPLHEAAIELIEIPMPRISGKNSADIRLVVDAMDLCYSKDHIDTFVIVSGDSDFSPLVSKLRENNKRVIGIGVKNSSSKLLINNCDEFIFYDDIYRQTQRRLGGTADNVPVDKRELFDFLVKTVQSLLQENRGVLYSSLIKDTMTRKQPDFTERAHGFSTFGDLLDEARKLGLLTVERDAAAGGTWVVHGLGSGVDADGSGNGDKPGERSGGGSSRSSRRRRRSGRGGGGDRTAADNAVTANADAAAKAEAATEGGDKPDTGKPAADKPAPQGRGQRGANQRSAGSRGSGRRSSGNEKPGNEKPAPGTPPNGNVADDAAPRPSRRSNRRPVAKPAEKALPMGRPTGKPANKLSRKVTTRKEAGEKAEVSKPTAKKPTAKKPTTKKTATKKVTKKVAKKLTTKKLATKKVATKKATTKKAPAKKAPAKKTAKKAATKKVAKKVAKKVTKKATTRKK